MTTTLEYIPTETMTVVSRSRSCKRVLAVMAAVLVLGLGACNEDNRYFPTRSGYIDEPPRNDSTVTSFVHSITLTDGQANLTPEQQDNLSEFYIRTGRDTGDHYEFRTSFVSSGGGNSDRNSKLATEMRRAFIDQGVYADRIQIVHVPSYDNTLEVVVRRYVVMAPNCIYEERDTNYDWSKDPIGTRQLGCSNEQNLGMMLADPRDLIEGRPGASSSAGRAAIGIEQYRTGKIPALPEYNTQSK